MSKNKPASPILLGSSLYLVLLWLIVLFQTSIFHNWSIKHFYLGIDSIPALLDGNIIDNLLSKGKSWLVISAIFFLLEIILYFYLNNFFFKKLKTTTQRGSQSLRWSYLFLNLVPIFLLLVGVISSFQTSLTLYQDYTAFRSLDLDQVIKGLNHEISTMPLNTLKDIQAILESLKRYIHDNSILLNMYNSFFKQYDLVANLLAWWNNCFLLLLSLESFLQIRLFWRNKSSFKRLSLTITYKKD